jgi:hypothetical protein
MGATLFGHAALVPSPAQPVAPPASQAATPAVGTPTPHQDAPPSLGNTVADPEMSERARQMRDAAFADAGRRPASFGKTMALGGGGDAPPSAAVTVPVLPAQANPPKVDSASVDVAPASRAAASLPSDKQTMLGIPAIGLPPPAATPPPSQAFPPAQKTMMGVAIPGIAPTHEPAPPPARAGTLLGVAAPGIAPLRAGTPGAAFTAAPAPAPPIVPAPPPLVMEPLPEAPRLPRAKGVPALAVVGIVFALVASAAAVAAFFVLRSGAPLTAQPQLDENGRESLKIRCESCPDGTMVSLGASSAKVAGAVTLLPLPAPLSIGDNDLEMKIDRPAAGRDETVKVHVPVAYRVKTDLSTLTASPPSVTVRVDAAPGTEVVVDGKPIALADGKGSLPIDITADVEGPSDETRTIDRKIPFSVKTKGAATPETGQLAIRVSVAPLHIDAPGVELYTDRTTGNISGQVKPSSTLTIDGKPVAVDPAQGRFAVRVELPSAAEKTLTIAASAPPLAPRTVHAKIVRVASLDEAAKTLDAKSPITFDAYAADPKAKVGQLAVVEGEVQDVRIAQGQTVMAIEEKKTCARGPAACVVRVVHGEEVRAARGDSIRAYGRVAGTASLNGSTIPDIAGVLVLPKRTAKK